VKIASQHPKSQHLAAREKMVEGFLFDGIHLQSRNVPVWNHQAPLAVEPHSANATFTGTEQTAMCTRLTTQALFYGRLNQGGRNGQGVKLFDGFHITSPFRL
jgi:hypothetical protein